MIDYKKYKIKSLILFFFVDKILKPQTKPFLSEVFYEA